MVVLGVPHSPTTDVAVLRCSIGTSDQLPFVPGPAIRTGAARSTLPSKSKKAFDKAVLLRRVGRRLRQFFNNEYVPLIRRRNKS